MEKTLNIFLNRFEDVPNSLRLSRTDPTPRKTITVSLASLYHHYYLDSYGKVPPNPDPAQFEYLAFLLPTDEFRLAGDGIGIAPGFRRHSSTELGQAFCRMFLHDHFRITYFAHVQSLLGKGIRRPFSVRIDRLHDGDTPDYLCASDTRQVFLSEAKGRYTSISFKSREFDSWRCQFGRVTVKNQTGQTKRLKGYIVASRFATEQKPAVESGIFAEDPISGGGGQLNEEETQQSAALAIALHYSGIAEKLDQPILAAALANGFSVPEQIQFPVSIWAFQLGPLEGRRFVGGYYPSEEVLPAFAKINNRIVPHNAPFRLDIGRGTFFGLEETIFRQLVGMARGKPALATQIRPFEPIEPFYSAISILRDGSIIAPLDFFALEEQVSF